MMQLIEFQALEGSETIVGLENLVLGAGADQDLTVVTS